MTLPLPPNLFAACPAPLGDTFKAWQGGQRTDADLQEASRFYTLDHLDDFRPQPLPSPPQEVARYRLLPLAQRRDLSAEERRGYYAEWDWFFRREEEVRGRNWANRFWLGQVLTWAMEKSLPQEVLHRIQAVVDLHDHTALTAWHDDGRAVT